jgi:hypothetical protein
VAGNEYREIIERLDRIEAHLSDPKGLFVRMDRVEQRQALFAWVVGAVFVAFLAAAVPAAWSFVDRMNRMELHQTTVATGKP